MNTLSSLRLGVLFCALYSGLALFLQAGLTNFTDRGKIDFDTAIQLLNPYGTWSKINGKWAYTPLDHQAPYTNGRWIYTEYGWYWKGNLPHSWVTEHYGYWKRNPGGVWSWFPGPYWLPEIIEIRATATDIGWHCAEVDDEGNFVEPPADRYAKTEEWTFVTLAQFANPITPDIVEKPDRVKGLLEDSVDCRHTYVTYRAIDRPGPHPADFVALCRDGKMFAPLTLQDQAAFHPATPSPNPPALTPPKVTTMTGTNAPTLLGAEIDPAADQRRVKYWITMSLPTFWTKPPPDAKPGEFYSYRPDFYQDQDGIARRITLWLDPKKRSTSKQSLSELLGGGISVPKVSPKAGAAPAIPAVPVASSLARDPFQSPFEDSFHPTSTARSSSSSSKAPAPPANVPAPDALIPPPLVTNAAPVNPQ